MRVILGESETEPVGDVFEVGVGTSEFGGDGVSFGVDGSTDLFLPVRVISQCFAVKC